MRRGIKEHLVRWKVYSSDFDSWVKASDIKKFKNNGTQHFYITRYSNASQKLYPDNTQADFTCHLAQPVDLGTSSDWELGVCEVTYFPPKRIVMRDSVLDYVSLLNGLIYCDLITPQFVGKDKVRLMRPIILWPANGIHLYQIFIIFV